MAESLPTVLIPGLLCSPRLYGEQLPALWRFGPVVLADHTRDDSMRGIARRILAVAPRRFTLVGLSMGGYVAFEIMRTSPDRVVRLVLLATSARADTPERTDHRHAQITLARNGRFGEVLDQLFPVWVHRSRRNDEVLRRIVQRMAEETGPEAFIRQQTAIMTRPDSRSDLSAIRCPTLVLVGDGDESTPPDRAAEIANGIATARLLTIPECGHLSTLEQPQHITRVLTEWLETA
ncbi:MAG TPA: alpha/beta fold hydrolase [bacterium]|nr:alpha/beta fold hydrolase [bacterium]